MRKWIWIASAALGVLLLGGAFSVRPLVRGQLLSRAAERGVQLEVGRLSLGYPTLGLSGVRARLEGVPGLSVDLREVELTLGLTGPALRGVEIRGGSVRLSGEPERVVEELRAFREKHLPRGGGEAAPSTGSSRREVVRDLAFSWSLGPGERLEVTGLQFEGLPGSPARLGIDLAALTLPSLVLEIAGGEVAWVDSSRRFSLERVGASEVRLDFLGTSSESSGDVPSGQDGSPSAAVASPASSQSEAEGLAGRLRVDPARVAKLQTVLAAFRREAGPRLPREMSVERLWLGLEAASERMTIGPSRLRARRSDQAMELSLSPRKDAKGTPLELSGRIPFTNSQPITASLLGGPVSLASLGVREGDFGLTGVASALVAAEGDVVLSKDAREVSARGRVSLENLSLFVEKVADDVISIPQLVVRGSGGLNLDGSEYRLEEAELTLNQARFGGDFRIRRSGEQVHLKAHVEAPLVSCQALADSAPRALLGDVAGMRWGGTFSLFAGVEADSNALAKMKVRWDFENGCRITDVPIRLDPEQFRGGFRRQVLGPGGIPMELEFGPHSANWVPFSDIAPYMEAAVLVTEDGRFFRHSGFDDRAIESAIRDNTKAGHFTRGASTISMQLAKNLYLSREKTLSRKLREAALTILLEQHFTKQELLELYLNVIEFAPGIYGIGPAAAHYFGIEPRHLSAAQAFFLASILPAPTLSYFDADGKLSPSREKHVDYLLAIAQKRGRLNEAELEVAQAEELRFGVSHAKTTQPDSNDRGVHAVPSEEGGPLAFPPDERPGRALGAPPLDSNLPHGLGDGP